MTEQEKIAFENEIRQKVVEEQRAYRAKWREKNREQIRNYDRAYRKRKKKLNEEGKKHEQHD